MTYHMPTEITFGEGCLTTLRESVDSYKNIALFTGGSSLKKSGVLDQVLSLLDGKSVQIFPSVNAEPETSALESAVQKLKSEQCDCVVAIGGGSVLDLAKSAALCAMQDREVMEVLNGTMQSLTSSLPVVAIPTTAGTGSEVTPFTVFWNHDEKKKYSMHYDELFPTYALVDPELTYTMPPAVTACTGMDAFTQACEAYWNRNHNPTSDAHALEAISLILPALPRAVSDGGDEEARHDMMLGSLRAGQAFSNTRTTACHSISYPMTLFFGVTHGQAVSITLPEVLLLNAEVMSERVEDFCNALGVSSPEDAASAIRDMMKRVFLKTHLSDLGIDQEGIDLIVEHGFTPERMGNTPYEFTEKMLRTMLNRIA